MTLLQRRHAEGSLKLGVRCCRASLRAACLLAALCGGQPPPSVLNGDAVAYFRRDAAFSGPKGLAAAERQTAKGFPVLVQAHYFLHHF